MKILMTGAYGKPRVYELHPQYDSRASFYGKAQVVDYGDELELLSYGTTVARIKDGKVVLDGRRQFSSTTDRHIKEFFKQFAPDYMK